MVKSTLKQSLEEKGYLEKGIIVSSLLIKEIEVCGFLNGVQNYQHTDERLLHLYSSILNKAPHRMIVHSGMVHQVIEYFDGKAITSMDSLFKIYSFLTVNDKKLDIELKDIHIPTLEISSFYNELRRGFSRPMTEEKLRKSRFPDFIKVKDDKVVCEVEPGKVLCLNAKRQIRALGEDVQVLCRYLHSETGAMCYTIYSLNELYVNK